MLPGEAAESYVTRSAVRLVPLGTATVAFEPTEQPGAETDVPPDRVTPEPFWDSAIMHAGPADLSSAYADALIRVLSGAPKTETSDNARLPEMTTLTAWFPSPLGELTSAIETPLLATPLRLASHFACVLIDDVEDVAE